MTTGDQGQQRIALWTAVQQWARDVPSILEQVGVRLDELPAYRRAAGVDVLALVQLLVQYTGQLEAGSEPIRAVYAARIALRDLQGQGVEGMERAHAALGQYLVRAGYDTSDQGDPVVATWARLAEHPVHEDLADAYRCWDYGATVAKELLDQWLCRDPDTRGLHIGAHVQVAAEDHSGPGTVLEPDWHPGGVFGRPVGYLVQTGPSPLDADMYLAEELQSRCC